MHVHLLKRVKSSKQSTVSITLAGLLACDTAVILSREVSLRACVYSRLRVFVYLSSIKLEFVAHDGVILG